MLRNDYETLTLDEAQVRYELDQLKKQLSKKLEERDEAHADRIKALEKTLQEKECDWVTKNENLRRDLRQAIRSSIQDTEREVESIDNLEQVNVSFGLFEIYQNHLSFMHWVQFSP